MRKIECTCPGKSVILGGFVWPDQFLYRRNGSMWPFCCLVLDEKMCAKSQHLKFGDSACTHIETWGLTASTSFSAHMRAVTIACWALVG